MDDATALQRKLIFMKHLRSIKSKCPTAGESDDFAQTVFVAWLEREGKTPSRDPERMLFGIAKRHCALLLRKLRRQRSCYSRYANLEGDNCQRDVWHDDPHVMLEDKERHQAVADAARSLQSDLRRIIEQRTDRSESWNELALKEGVPVETLRTRHKRAVSEMQVYPSVAAMR